MEYVCGLMFTEDRRKVLLIQKDRPKWQAGRLNGVGGKIEETDTSPYTAMVREFKEEVGIDTTVDDWELFAITQGTDSTIYNFRAFNEKARDHKQMESEIPVLVQPKMIEDYPTVPNIQFLLPMALYTKEIFTIKCQIKG